MKFSNIEADEKTGELRFDVSVSKDEISYLVDHAVNHLIAAGVITLSGLSSEEEVTLDTNPNVHLN